MKERDYRLKVVKEQRFDLKPKTCNYVNAVVSSHASSISCVVASGLCRATIHIHSILSIAARANKADISISIHSFRLQTVFFFRSTTFMAEQQFKENPAEEFKVNMFKSSHVHNNIDFDDADIFKQLYGKCKCVCIVAKDSCLHLCTRSMCEVINTKIESTKKTQFLNLSAVQLH